MLTGIDTSFFYALAAGRPLAVAAWEGRELATSALCFFELRKRALKGDLKSWPTVLDDIAKAVQVVPLTVAAALQAARVAHGTGMPAFDALIVSSLAEAGCAEILTLDHHFSLFAKKGLKVVQLAEAS